MRAGLSSIVSLEFVGGFALPQVVEGAVSLEAAAGDVVAGIALAMLIRANDQNQRANMAVDVELISVSKKEQEDTGYSTYIATSQHRGRHDVPRGRCL
jgi:hypothetical protein